MARFLCTADVHIGRCSSLGEEGDPRDHSALAAWERAVDLAIEERADGVLIAGDFYDSLPAQYQSRRRVRESLGKLRDARIPAVAVAGNHDCDALPDFAQLSRDLIHVFDCGQWGEQVIGGVRIVGRSFPGERCRESMLRGFAAPADGVPTIGLIHADIDGQGEYGPTPLADFGDGGVAAWLAGHVHAPRRFAEGRVIYPGSPQALDWGETGAHGVCWLEVGNGPARFSEVQPVSTTHYEYLDLKLDRDASLDELVQARAEELRASCPGVFAQFRVRLQVPDGYAREIPPHGSLEGGWYDVCSRTTIRDVNLQAEAAQSDARGQAARLMLGLDGAGEKAWQEKAQELVQRVFTQMRGERAKLRLPPSEAVQMLRVAKPEDAREAVRRVLQRVLATQGGAQ